MRQCEAMETGREESEAFASLSSFSDLMTVVVVPVIIAREAQCQNSLLCENDDIAAAKKGDADDITDNEIEVVQEVRQSNVVRVEEVGEQADISNGDINIVPAQDWAVVEDVVERSQVVERINHLNVHDIVRLDLQHSGNQARRPACLTLTCTATTLALRHNACGAATEE